MNDLKVEILFIPVLENKKNPNFSAGICIN